MPRKRKELERLPTWEIRLDIWFDQLKKDMFTRGLISDVDVNTYKLHNAIGDIKGIPNDGKVFDNWVKKAHYPEISNIRNLQEASYQSSKWLFVEKDQNQLQDFLSSIDYFCCSLNKEIQPTLFKQEQQASFADRCLSSISQRWNISFDLSESQSIQDVSLSMLNTHSTSAIPFYMCSLASDQALLNSDLECWYLDLLCSTFICAGDIHRQRFEQEQSLNRDIDTKTLGNYEFAGTSTSLLRLVGEFVADSSISPLLNYLNDHYYDVDEIQDSAVLLEHLLKGNMALREQLKGLNISLKFISEVLQQHLGGKYPATISIIERSEKYINRPWEDIEPSVSFDREPEPVIYHLINGSTNRVERQHRNYGSPTMVACKYPHKAEDDHYSWGYLGTGVYYMAYTLLYDLFKNCSYENRRLPTRAEQDLVVYKLLSRLNSQLNYSITSAQLCKALETPYLKTRTEPDEITMKEFHSAVDW